MAVQKILSMFVYCHVRSVGRCDHERGLAPAQVKVGGGIGGAALCALRGCHGKEAHSTVRTGIRRAAFFTVGDITLYAMAVLGELYRVHRNEGDFIGEPNRQQKIVLAQSGKIG